MAVYYTVQYNGYTFKHVTLDWSEESVYAADKMTYEATAYKFTVSGWIVETSQEAFNSAITSIKCALRTPRQDFTAVWNSDEEGNGPQAPIQITSAENETSGYAVDVAWGPLPANLKINTIIAGRSAQYSWTLSSQTKECYSLGNCALNTSGYSYILSLVAKWTHTIDSAGLTTRTVSGSLVLSSEAIELNNTAADAFRGFVQPALPAGFKPETQTYTQSEDGRVLTFSCTQTEKYVVLPTYIVDGQVTASSQWESFGGLVVLTFSGFFTVGKNSPNGKLDALNALTNLINNRIAGFSQGVIPINSELTDDVYTGKLSFNLSYNVPFIVIQNNNNTANVITSTFSASKIGAIPTLSQSNQSQLIGPYGWDANNNASNVGSGVIATVPAPLDSCTEIATPLGNSNAAVPPINIATGGSPLPNVVNPGSPTNAASQANQQNPYYEYHEEISFHINNGYVVFRPKSSTGVGILVQQTCQPTVIITQAGYCSQAFSSSSSSPVPAPPFYGASDGAWQLSSDITPATSVPIGQGGYSLCTIHWRYVMQLEGPFESTDDIGMFYPIDPRRAGNGGSVDDPYGGSDVDYNNPVYLPSSDPTYNNIVNFPS